MLYKIISKRMDIQTRKFIFTIQLSENRHLECFADDIARDKTILLALDTYDVFDIAYTQGTETILHHLNTIQDIRRKQT